MTTDDLLREVAAAVRDLAGIVGELAAETREANRLAREVAVIAKPAATHFEAFNREHAESIASAAEADKRRQATMDEWLAWLTPTRAVGIITALVTLWGTGLPGWLKSALAAIVEAQP